MHRTQRLTLLSTLTAAALAGVTVTAAAQQEPYPQKPNPPVETGAVDSTKQLPPSAQPTNPSVAPNAATDTTMTKDTAKKSKKAAAKPGAPADTSKPKN